MKEFSVKFCASFLRYINLASSVNILWTKSATPRCLSSCHSNLYFFDQLGEFPGLKQLSCLFHRFLSDTGAGTTDMGEEAGSTEEDEDSEDEGSANDTGDENVSIIS